MTTDVKRYLRALRRSLPCEGAPKKRLMDSFNASLSAFLEETPEPDMLTLHRAFGPPNEMASTLANTLTEEDVNRSNRAKVLRKVLAVSAVAAGIVALTMAIYVLAFYLQPITIIEEITIYPVIPE